VRQRLLFESGYVALARRGHPGVETISNVQGDFSARATWITRTEGTGRAIVERTLRKCRISTRLRRSWGPRSGRDVPRPLGVPMAVAAPIEILSHPLKLPKLVIRVFRHEHFDAEPALMWLRKTLRVVVANASQLQPPRSK
jgi:hypothetical protein